MRKIVAFLIICFFTMNNSIAANTLNEKVSFDDFSTIIMFNIARVPELSNLWSFAGQNGHPDVYLTGGIVRGILHWHYVQLQKYTVAELKRAVPPLLKDFQVLGGNDIDIVGPIIYEQTVRKSLSSNLDVDFIPLPHFYDLIEMGGPTLEKMAISPNGLIDPLGGLYSYFNGQLKFSVPEKETFRSLDPVKNGDYTKTVEALRFIRFLFNLPELTPTSESIKTIQSLINEELDLLKEEHRKEWVYITLKKLLISAKGDVTLVLNQLKKYNLLELLAKSDIYFEQENPFEKIVDTKKLEEFTPVDLDFTRLLVRQKKTLAQSLWTNLKNIIFFRHLNGSFKGLEKSLCVKHYTND